MSYLVSDLKNDIAGALHGTTTNKVNGLNNIILRAARQLLLDIDPQETKRIAQLSNALYDQVYDYVAPSDLKGKKVVRIGPQVNRSLGDSFAQHQTDDFDLYKTNDSFAVQNNSGVKTVRISKSLTAGILLNECESTTANGTWAVGGDASNLAADTLYKVTGAGSLSFDASGSTGSAYLQNYTQTAVDLSTHLNKSAIFVWIYLPSTTNFTSVTLRWGSSASAYWSVTVTSSHFATAFQTGWNLLRFDWNGATQSGSPSSSSITYLRVTYTSTAGTSFTTLRLDSIYSKLPTIYEMEYFSKYLFSSSSGTWQEAIVDDSDLINLDTESYNLLFNKTMVLLAPQVQGKNAAFDVTFYKGEYDAGVKKYTGQYKSDAKKPQGTYYQVRKRR
ncbi:MAG: hypothetical protein ACLGJB_17835 [Blastocatellia bacterium]